MSSSHASVLRSISIVRLAFVTSVMCRPPSVPPVRFQMQPGVHVAEGQVARLGPIARAIDVVEDPADLRAREVGRQRQADLLAEAILAAVGRQLVDELVRAGVLPHERVVDGLARVAVPHHRGLALVGDAQRGDVVRARPGRLEGLVEDLLRARPDLLGVVLDPTGLRIDLLVLLLRHRLDAALVVEDHRPRAGGALVQGCCELRHSVFSFQPASASAALLKR